MNSVWTEGGSFGERLRAHRLAFGLTQEQLAERAGLSRCGIADLERGSRSAPYRDTVDRLAAAPVPSAPADGYSLAEACPPELQRPAALQIEALRYIAI